MHRPDTIAIEKTMDTLNITIEELLDKTNQWLIENPSLEKEKRYLFILHFRDCILTYMKDRGQEFGGEEFKTANLRIDKGKYEQFMSHTEMLNIEVNSSAVSVYVFVTFLPENDIGTFKILISIPSWKYSFFAPLTASQLTVSLLLEEAQNKAQEWIEPVSEGIVNGMQEIYQNILTKLEK